MINDHGRGAPIVSVAMRACLVPDWRFGEKGLSAWLRSSRASFRLQAQIFDIKHQPHKLQNIRQQTRGHSGRGDRGQHCAGSQSALKIDNEDFALFFGGPRFRGTRILLFASTSSHNH